MKLFKIGYTVALLGNCKPCLEGHLAWTANANLLGTLKSQQGYNAVVNAIIAASPVIHNTYNVSDIGGSDSTHGKGTFKV
jgi:hypothetical protein